MELKRGMIAAPVRCSIFMAVLFTYAFTGNTAQANELVVYVVRHADKECGSGDVPLHKDGQRRADELGRVLNARLPAGSAIEVHHTPLARSLETATRAAAILGTPEVTAPTICYNHRRRDCTPTNNWSSMKEHILKNRGRHLIVAHMETIIWLVKQFGRTSDRPPASDEYDRLYVIEIPGASVTGTPELESYGDPYDPARSPRCP